MNNLNQNELSHFIKSCFEKIMDFNIDDIHQNFFMLGGNSIQALEIINLINEKLNTDISITDFFDALTPYKISKFIHENISIFTF